MKNILRAALVLFCTFLLLFLTAYFALYLQRSYRIDYSVEPEPGQIKIACVGDSITFGFGTSQWPVHAYPTVLQGLLGDRYHVQNFGVSGFSVQQSADMPYRGTAEYYRSLEYDADIVVFMMGGNDTKPVNWNGAENFRRELLSFLDSYGDAEILLCTISAMFFEKEQGDEQDVFRLQPHIGVEISEVIRSVAEERSYPMVDIQELTSSHPEWFLDGVHPGNRGSAAIAREIYAAIENILPGERA